MSENISRDGKNLTYDGFEVVEVFWCHSIGLGDDWDQVDSCTKLLHDLHIKWFQPAIL